MKKKSAFSLIELSIVLLVIGLAIAGVYSSNEMIAKYRLYNAKKLTSASVVPRLEGLVGWWETSFKENFTIGEYKENNTISTWYEYNPTVTKNQRNNATQSISDSKPILIKKSFNNAIPGIRFDGIDDYLSFDGLGIVGRDYTIFVVEKRIAAQTTHSYFIGGQTEATNSNFHFGYNTDTKIRIGHYSNDLNHDTNAFSSSQAAFHTAELSTSSGRRYWQNGGSSPDQAEVSYTSPLVGFAGASFARFRNDGFYNGDLAEIIIYNRRLKDSQRDKVHDYLSKKYKIAIE